jgi:hypothetical protein
VAHGFFSPAISCFHATSQKKQRRRVSPWALFAHLFGDSQWVNGNLEGALGPPSLCIEAARPCFATPDSAVTLLKLGGFHGLTLENNHTGDLGNAGRERTRKLLHQESLAAIDFENSPFVAQAGDAKIALVAITLIPAADGRAQLGFQASSCSVRREFLGSEKQIPRFIGNVSS